MKHGITPGTAASPPAAFDSPLLGLSRFRAFDATERAQLRQAIARRELDVDTLGAILRDALTLIEEQETTIEEHEEIFNHEGGTP